VYDRWHGWWRAEDLGHEPLFPFGFGLSYTTFRIEDVSISDTDDGFRISCWITNTGTRDGADVVQVYARFADPSTPRRLVGFRRVDIIAGESTQVDMDIMKHRLQQRHPTSRSWYEPTDEVELSITDHGVGMNESVLSVML
jgi:beta-glucosidase